MKIKVSLDKLKKFVLENKGKSIAIVCGSLCVFIAILIVVSLNCCNRAPDTENEGITDQDSSGAITALGDENYESKAGKNALQEPADDKQTSSATSNEDNDQQPSISQKEKRQPPIPELPAPTHEPASTASPNNNSSSEESTLPPVPTPAPEKRWVVDYQQVWVQDSDAWDEQIPLYSREQISVCNICGAEITGSEVSHGKDHMLAGEGSGHHTESKKIITGYETIHHEATGHYVTQEAGGHWE